MFCRLFWRRRGIKNGTQPFWPCPVAVSAVLPASRSAVRRISNRLCRGCGCGCVCRVLCRFPGASPRLSRPVSCSLRYGERSPQVSAGFRPCRRSSTGRGAAARGRVRGVSWRLSFFLRPLCRGLSSPVSRWSVACRGLQRSPSGGEPVPLFPVVLEVAIVLMTNRLLDSV